MDRMTDNPSAVIDEREFTVRRSVHINAPVEKVWAAVTDPAHISAWFGRAAFDGAGVGARGTLTFPGDHVVPIRVEAIDAPRSVSYRWASGDAPAGRAAELAPEHSTVFTMTLEPLAGGTRLTVVETGFEHLADPPAHLEDHRGGWNGELDKLVALMEGGS